MNVLGQRVQRARAAPDRADRARGGARGCRADRRSARELDQVIALQHARAGELRPDEPGADRVERADQGRKQVLNGGRVPLTTFAAAVAVAVSLMFVTVLLAAGVARARARPRTCSRGWCGGRSPAPPCWPRRCCSRARCALAGDAPDAAGLGRVRDARVGPLPALAGRARGRRGVAFAALGIADRRARARGVRGLAAGLHAAAAARVPGAGAVGGRERRGSTTSPARCRLLFPFKADAATRCSAALYGEGGLAGPLLHLAALAAAFGLAARLAVRRFG